MQDYTFQKKKKKGKRFKLMSQCFSQRPLTWILRKKGTTLAMDYFFDDGHFCGRRGWYQPQAWYHGVDGGDSSHHVETWIEAGHADGVCKAHEIDNIVAAGS